MNIDVIWKNIQYHEGKEFNTIRGVKFKYKIYSDFLLINDDRKRKITKDSFKIATTIENLSPSKIQREGIWGPSYVYGIITDERINDF